MAVARYDTTPVDSREYTGYSEFVDILDLRKFYSQGRNGKFELRIIVTRSKGNWDLDLFNIGFGVWDETLQIIDDSVQTKNDDMPKILGTLADYALSFLKKYPAAGLYAEGSTISRTRLYQREIAKVLSYVPPDLCIYGLVKQDEVGFIEFKRGTNFDAFLLSRR
ncbi:hypothetical protein DYBT9623_04180 [Dyadobacter sp. CECT 9623]|uniref:Uncharacterized protein n=1 Tax=Dyadobacter linearis TaxID=2823330 RepID=A0ABN7RHB0_9BACT|nr:hypothetical protein [Dyadobacter sp. CECT 9623]CAG5072519.1 hypothetical protein DYBT9623_04180 [Dyadobacter sp. CECT 9623]